MDSDVDLLNDPRTGYIRLRDDFIAGKPCSFIWSSPGQSWEILALELIEKVTELTYKCDSRQLSIAATKVEGDHLYVARQALLDLLEQMAQAEWKTHRNTADELKRVWAVFEMTCAERGCQTSAQSQSAEARLDAQAVLGRGETKHSIVTKAEYPGLCSWIHLASMQRFDEYHAVIYPDNTPSANDKWLDLLLYKATDWRDPDTIPDPHADVRSVLAGREQYYGDPAAATATLLSRSSTTDGEDGERARSIRWKSVAPLSSDPPAVPKNIESSAIVETDLQHGREVIGWTDAQTEFIKLRMDNPSLSWRSTEIQELLGWSPQETENVAKSMEPDRPTGRKTRKFFDAYLPSR